MDHCRRLVRGVYDRCINLSLVRWYFQLDYVDKEQTARLAQELVNSVKTICQYLNDFDLAVENELSKTISAMALDESKSLLEVFQHLETKFNSIQKLQEPSGNNEYTLSKRLTNQSCLSTLLDTKTSFGRKVRKIKDNCTEEDKGYVIVNITINFELQLKENIKTLLKICKLLRQSQLGNLPMNILHCKSDDIRREMLTYCPHAEHADLCTMLEEVLHELRPISKDFISKVSRMRAALEARFESDED